MMARVTPAQRRILEKLAHGDSAVDDAYSTHFTPGRAGRVEKTLALLADAGLVLWDGAVSDVTITDAGRAVVLRKEWK